MKKYLETIKTKKVLKNSTFNSREEGIRTLDTVTRILPFQGSSFNHSDTSLIEVANIMKYLIPPRIFKNLLSLLPKYFHRIIRRMTYHI